MHYWILSFGHTMIDKYLSYHLLLFQFTTWLLPLDIRIGLLNWDYSSKVSLEIN